MIVILGLIILIAAVVVAVAGIVTNGGIAHQLTDGFSVFGYHVTSSTGMLFLYGIVVGALAMVGLSLIVAAVRRPTVDDREDAIGQRETPRAETAYDRPHDGRPRSSASGGRGRWHFFGHRSAPR
ncbi:hypothetical protein [Streptomyces sp. NBC_01618]|uniref:hypothetical protein n=1 Tax=Streptomyces sp. NBC_01618 TaxID=2975900 RepID=UPI00386E6D5B|nr:hypothetical protein OH735_30890 [Streptomyces sp. NBC_01618]